MNPVFNFLFRKELRAYDQAFISFKNAAATAIREAKDEASQKSELYTLMERAFSDFPSGKIVGFEKSKMGLYMFAFEVLSDNSLNIYLYGTMYSALNAHPRILCDISQREGHKVIFIRDIKEIDDSRGNGSMLMSYLIREAKALNVEYIRGSLSFYDKDHFDRLEHFYKKHGFTVSFNKSKDGGSIILKLTNDGPLQIQQ